MMNRHVKDINEIFDNLYMIDIVCSCHYAQILELYLSQSINN